MYKHTLSDQSLCVQVCLVYEKLQASLSSTDLEFIPIPYYITQYIASVEVYILYCMLTEHWSNVLRGAYSN